MKKISIIIPVYNTEKYLKECLDSIICQTYKNLEIITVDDGSMDNSLAILKSYAEKDERIKVIEKENGGGGSARNCALDIASGDFITFVDSDDSIVPDACEKVLYYAEKYNADVVHCEVYKEPDEKRVESEDAPLVLDKKGLMEIMLNDKVRSGSIKFFKRDCVKDIRFPLNSSIDDMVYFSDAIENFNVMVISKLELYYYRYNREDNMSNLKPRFVKNVYERYLEFLKRYNIALKNGIDGTQAYTCAIEHALVFLAHYEVADQWQKERAEVFNYIKKNRRYILKNTHLSRRDKLKCKIICISENLYTKLCKKTRSKAAANNAR